MNVLRTKIFYWHDKFHQRTGDLAIDKDGYIRIAIAQCHFKDNFNKKLGRKIVEGRILKDKCYRTFSHQTVPHPNYVKVSNLEEITDVFGDINIGFYLEDATLINKLVTLAQSGKYDLCQN
jgi:hypothetical protein